MGLVTVTATVCYPFTTAVPELSGAVLPVTFVPDPQLVLASGMNKHSWDETISLSLLKCA